MDVEKESFFAECLKLAYEMKHAHVCVFFEYEEHHSCVLLLLCLVSDALL